jgi:dihydroorotate dehydrogenase electron transfer subunit
VYLVAGKFTTRLARLPVGEPLEIWGPLGNGFEPQPTRHLLMVAGGIGQTPFLAAAAEALGLRQYGAPPRQPARCDLVTLLYGARSADYLAGLDDFRRLGVQLRLSTDDGSAGRRGFVTDLLAEELRAMSTAQRAATRVDCCGPEPMMHRVAETCGALGVACRISLETPMACGVGICFSCVARIRTPDGGWDYRRTCVEGPVFDAALVDF